jgi:hypothetical protein
MAEAELTNFIRKTQLPAPLDLQSCGLCDFTQPQGD